MFDAYEVAVKLKLNDQFSSIMGGVINKLTEGHKHADLLNKKLETIGKLFTTGALATGAGFGIAMALKASTNEAIRYEQQLNRLKGLNVDLRFGSGATNSLEQQALKIANSTKGTSNTEALRLITESQAITGDVGHTSEIAPLLAKLRFGMETYMSAGGKGEGHGAGAEKQFLDIVKVMEMRGLMRNFSTEKMERMADLFTKNYVASGGMVKPSDFLAMFKTGGTAAKSVGDDFMFAMGHIMQEKGGNRSGTALMSLYQNLVAGRMPQQIAETLKGLGLLSASAIHYGKAGHITKVDAGGLVGSKELIENPAAYMDKYILPALRAHGVDTNDTQSTLMKLNGLAGQRTASDFLAQMYLERTQIANYVAQAKNAMGVDDLYRQAGSSATGKEADFRAQLEKLEQAFGNAALPLLKSAMDELVPLVKEFGEWVNKNPGALKMLVTGIAGLSVAAMVSGPLMILGSGIGLLSTAAALASGPLGMVSVAMAFRGIGGATGLASLAGNLGSVAGQLKLIGVAGLGIMAWEAGQYVGGKINEHISPETGNHIGKWVSMWMAAFGSEEARNNLRKNNPEYHGPGMGSNTPLAAGTQKPVVQVTNHFDKNGITTMVAGGLAKKMNAGMNGGGNDLSLMLPLTGGL